jgi:inward rectifier potassium channel
MIKRSPKKPTHKVQIEGRQFIAHGVKSRFWQDIYHYAMTSSWTTFFTFFALIFLTLNFVFATLYVLGENSIANIYPQGFWGAFFFSVETIATVGYGDMHPQSLYGHVIATIEIFTGLSIVAMITGVMFARFSRPKAKILFTKHPVTYRHNGEHVLSIRIANTRLNIIAEASAKLRLIHMETTKENTQFLRIIDLPLKRDQHPMFSLGWNIFHVIDNNSPFYQQTIEDLDRDKARLVLSIHGIDETTNQTMRARHIYPAEMIRFNYRYKDISIFEDALTSHMDYNLFDVIIAEDSDYAI